ncbi:MAG: T9SS C-terminal target domain-containing protein [Myxococcales bacterium]|jgi:hypothetical protein|nr:T9SS C-terminal target domain-containing protein [Myxococcales bacterium]MBL0198075.1 T9SS C-terminal target domain-containing protein [Myxococcales bacterium]HQY61581.1 hypothetical protein [Polyangiaceae bacterium]
MSSRTFLRTSLFGPLVGLALPLAVCFTACSDDGSLSVDAKRTAATSPTGNPPSSGAAAPKALEVLKGDIKTAMNLTAAKEYLLQGLVVVKTGTTLTIEKGTTLKGDARSKAILLVEAGAKLIAEGTEDEPIVFTSQAAPQDRRAGDWGGLVLLGNAPVNMPGGKGNVEGILTTVQGTQFGGTDPDDSSGVLRYVRVEYAGVVLAQDNEVNGVTFAGVGRGTRVDHVQVRQALDDCFEFFGGTVDAKYLACQGNEDDGFDWDNGYSGRLQFLVLQQSPGHVGEDNGIEGDNDAQGSANLPLSSPTIFNASLFGKNADVDNAQYGLLLRRNTRATLRNVLVSGFEASLDVRDVSTHAGVTEGALTLTNSLFWNARNTAVLDNIAYPEKGATPPNKDNDGALSEVDWVKATAHKNLFSVDPKTDRAFDLEKPVFGPASPLVETAATPPKDGFFDPSAAYVGAFKDQSDDWATRGRWAVWSSR